MVTVDRGNSAQIFTAGSDPLQIPPGEPFNKWKSASAGGRTLGKSARSSWKKNNPVVKPRSHGGDSAETNQLTSIDSPQHNNFRSATSFDSFPWLKLSRIAAFTSPAVFIR